MLVNSTIFKQEIQTTASFNFDQQTARKALAVENGLIRTIFTSDLVDRLNEAWSIRETDPLPEHVAIFIGYIQAAICNLSLAKSLPKMIGALTGSGALQAENNSKKPLYEWQKLEIENSLLEDGWTAIEDAIEFSILKQTESFFDAFKSTNEFKSFRKMIIPNAKDFDEVYPIGKSRRTYESIKSCMNDVEAFYIKPALGTAYTNYIEQQQTIEGLQDGYLELKPLAQAAIANLSIEIALSKLEFKFDEEGARVISTSASSEKAKIKGVASADTKKLAAEKCHEIGMKYLNDLQVLAQSLAIIPTPTTVKIDNSTGSSFIF